MHFDVKAKIPYAKIIAKPMEDKVMALNSNCPGRS
jgi:hypothetical protein